MNQEKDTAKKKKFNFIIIYILGFIISVFFEFYWINYYPYDYFMLFGIGIILCIFGYLSIDGILDMVNKASLKREEQAEMMIKASKAIFLTVKKMNPDGGVDGADAPKDINTLIDDLAKANERLTKEVENAISIQGLVQDSKKIVQNVHEVINEGSILEAATDEPDVSQQEETSVPEESSVPEASEVSGEQQKPQPLSEDEVASLFANL